MKTLLLCLFLSGLNAAFGQSLTPLPGTGKLGKGSEHFTFIMGGDNRPKEKDEVQSLDSVPGKIFGQISKHKPAFVCWTGDTIYGKRPEDESLIQAEYEGFLEIARQGGVPVFNAPGNHEMNDMDNVPKEQMQEWYDKYMGPRYGSFDYGNSHFIALDTEEVPPKGMKRSEGPKTKSGKKIDPGYISPEQLEWLKEDLQEHAKARHVFIFMHHPIYPRYPEWALDHRSADPLKSIIGKFSNISYVIAGHEHLFYNHQEPGSLLPTSRPKASSDKPPYYLVSGGAGAPLEKDPQDRDQPAPGAFYHYLVFEVDGEDVKVTLQKL